MRDSFENIILEDFFLDDRHIYLPGHDGCHFRFDDLLYISSALMSDRRGEIGGASLRSLSRVRYGASATVSVTESGARGRTPSKARADGARHPTFSLERVIRP